MKTNVKIQLLTIERDRLKEMIEELEDKSYFAWGRSVCPVCKEAERVRHSELDRCTKCRLFGISARCNYINDFQDQGTYDGEIGENAYNIGEVEYMQNLFANYIRQIDEQLEELK